MAMHRLSGLVRSTMEGSVLRALRPLWLSEHRATVCSVCSTLIRRARQQHVLKQLERQLEQGHRPLSEIHLPQKQQLLLLLPTARRLQHTTRHSSSGPISSAPSPPGDRDGSHDVHWTYTGENGVDHWATLFPTCGGQSQSPVNIDTAQLKRDYKLFPFNLINFDQVNDDIEWSLQNNGHSAQVTFGGENDLFVSGGGLRNKYKVAQFHFHWGSNDSVGSEHTVDGHRYPMEMHIVTYNTKYGDMGNAAQFKDGLAVLGAFFEVVTANNDNFDGLLSALGNVQMPGASTLVNPMQLDSLMPDTNKFYRYSGSLTTPPCSEVVIWTLFKHPVPISSSQLAVFRALKTEVEKDVFEPLVNNFRPVQPLNGRQITRNY